MHASIQFKGGLIGRDIVRCQALPHLGLVTKKIPTLTKQQQHEEAKALKQVKDHSNNERNGRRTTCFAFDIPTTSGPDQSTQS